MGHVEQQLFAGVSPNTRHRGPAFPNRVVGASHHDEHLISAPLLRCRDAGYSNTIRKRRSSVQKARIAPTSGMMRSRSALA